MDGRIKALRVDTLHELEALQWRGCYRGPEDGAGVVDEDINASVFLGILVLASSE